MTRKEAERLVKIISAPPRIYTAQAAGEVAAERQAAIDAVLAALTTPEPHADDVALVDELLDRHSDYQHATDAELDEFRADFKKARAAVLARMAVPAGWQDISTAPTKYVPDTPYLLWDKKYDIPEVAWLSPDAPGWFDADGAPVWASHWMPLPAAPEVPR